MNEQTRWLWRRVRAVLLVLLAAASGCQSGESTAGAGQLASAVTDYEERRYSEAEATALRVYNNSQPPVRERAAYILGLCEQKRGRQDDAERRFMYAASSEESVTAGKAKAMLGVIRLDQGRARDAATLFAEAHGQLEGEDARQAARHAGIAYQQIGDNAAAQRYFALAGENGQNSGGGTGQVHNPAVVQGSGSFTLQVGAFNERARAEKACADARTAAAQAGLGPVRIVDSKDRRGNRLYLVHMGQFHSRQAAADARARIGRLEYIVATASANP